LANSQVTLIWRCKTDAGWRQFKAVTGGNGRVRKGVVMVGDPPVERHYPEGTYQLRYYEGNKMVYKTVGPESKKAMDEKAVLENLLKTRITAAAAGVQVVEDPERRTLAMVQEAFLQAAEDRGSNEAVIVYRTALKEFFQVVTKTYVDELRAEDMLAYQRHLRQRGCSDRTIHNRFANTKAFFLYCGFDSKKMPREDGESQALTAPNFEEQTPEIYEPEELKPFFAEIKDDHATYAACQIMLKCGLREQEMTYLEWKNVNLKRGVVHIEGNPYYGFKVKDSEQRDIPIPTDLVNWLQQYRHARPHDRLVSPTAQGKPSTKFLRTVKRAATRAGLNCNACKGCDLLAKHGSGHTNEYGCHHWFLHKFRATAITMWLRSGLDLRTVMKLSGHANLESVMRYLSPASDKSVRQHVMGIDWGD
jgi:integrase